MIIFNKKGAFPEEDAHRFYIKTIGIMLIYHFFFKSPETSDIFVFLSPNSSEI